MQKKVDYIIVGQGIVGSLLAYFLSKENQSVLVIDKQIPGAASIHSSGVINPITGRRFAKSWNIDTLLPFAKKTYLDIEAVLEENIINSVEFCKLINSIKDENDLSVDMNSSEYLPYFPKQDKTFLDPLCFNTPLGSYIIKEGLKINIEFFINKYRALLVEKNQLVDELFNYAKLDIDNSIYDQIEFKKIIFCQGFANIHNPYFNFIQIIPNKGEYLILKTKKPHLLNYTITSNGIISPLSDDTLYIGATYEWIGENTEISTSATKHLVEVFENVCKHEYEIIKQGVGLRPAIQIRKPILGVHPDFPNLAIINGMGTKGTMLAPFYTHQFTQFLLYQKPIDSEVSIKK